MSTTALVTALGIDRGNWATWACRGGIVPAPMPAAWFRPARGQPRVYRVDVVLGWLASRHGERTETVDTWRDWLVAHLGMVIQEPEQVRAWAHRFAKNTGPAAAGFTNTGFDAYLDTLT